MIKGEKIAKTIIGTGIIIWLIQESVIFYEYWQHPLIIDSGWFFMMMIADWFAILAILAFFFSQYLEKRSEIFSFFAQIAFYVYSFITIFGHLELAPQFFPMMVLIFAMIIFLLVLHIITRLKKREKRGYLLSIQAIGAVMVAIFDLLLGHAFRYSISDSPIRLGLTFLPVVLEFLLTIAFVTFLLVKTNLAGKTQKIVGIFLSLLGVFGLMTNIISIMASVEFNGYVMKISGDIILVLGVILYFFFSLRSLRNFYKMEEENISEQK